jgi:hypothetical protein
MYYLPFYPIFASIAVQIRLKLSTDFCSSISRARAPNVSSLTVTEIVMDPTLLISPRSKFFRI